MLLRNCFRFFLLPFLFCFILQSSHAQDSVPITFGKVTIPDFDLPKSKAIDSNSTAVVIANIGSVEFIGNKIDDWVSLVFTKKIRIKILSKKAFELASVKIRLYGEGSYEDKLDDFHAVTYNISNEKVTETQLNEKDIFTEKIRKYVDEERFTMPDVKEGSIIEYSYKITSFHYYYVPAWNFQFLHYPCLYSEFKIGVPDLLRFLQIKYGIDSFYSSTSKDTYTSLNMADVKVSTKIHNHTWIMKDIPVFKREEYISEPENFLDKIEFTLSQVYNGQNVANIYTDWKSAETRLRLSKWFGAAINVDNTSNLTNVMNRVCSPDDDNMAAAKKIYTYIQSNFTCIPDDDIYIQTDLYDVNKSHKGSVSELNMLLIALLRQRGINANPLILATRSYGINPETYPVLEKLNYVLCMMTYGKDTFFLDASDHNMGFGKIPLECYNGHARMISEQQSGPVYLFPSDIKEPNLTSVLLVNDEKENSENGSFEKTFGYYESADLRSIIKENGGQQKYLKNLKKDYGADVEVSNLHIDSLTDIEKPVKINYDINYKNGFEGDIIYFNPIIRGGYKENPFKATDRKYPVELPYPINDTYNITMDIPNGYKVDELPKSVQATFNGVEGIFVYQMIKDEYTVQLHMQLKINKAFFLPEDYSSLRDFFTMVVKKQSEQIVFKKK